MDGPDARGGRAARFGGLIVFARSALAGAAATVADMAALFVLVTLLDVSPRVASVPALLIGATVNFFGNRAFAFRSKGAALPQALRFALVLVVTLALTALLFDLGARALGPAARSWYWALRLVVSNAVYLGWSFPMFRLVFGPPRKGQ